MNTILYLAGGFLLGYFVIGPALFALKEWLARRKAAKK